MNIWILTIGEPLPIAHSVSDRSHRSVFFGKLLAEQGNHVLLWTSCFDHFNKKFYSENDIRIAYNDHLELFLLNGGGYRKNISFSRFWDHLRIADKFKRYSESMAPPDIILSSLPSIELCSEAVSYGKRHRIPVVLDMRDMWPDIFIEYMPKLMQPFGKLIFSPLFKKAATACGSANAITGITEQFVEWGVQRGNRKRRPLDRSFPMGYLSDRSQIEKNTEADAFWDAQGILQDGKTFRICFFGSLNNQFDLEPIFAAAEKLIHSDPNVQFVICGDGERLPLFREKSASLSNIRFPGWVNSSQILSLMNRSSLGLDPLPDRFDFLATINNKAIEYLSTGLPVLSSPKKGVLFELLKDYDCGSSYDATNVDECVSIIHHYNSNLSFRARQRANAKEVFLNSFEAKSIYGNMANHLNDVIHHYRSEL